MERLMRWVVPALLLFSTGACAHRGEGRFQELFQEGRYGEAVAEAERGTGIAASEDVLYHVALAHMVPESGIYDPFRAEGLLNELLARYPGGSRALEARLLAGQLAATRLAERNVRRAEHAADSVAWVLDSAQDARQALEAQGEARTQEVAQLRARVRSLEAELQLRQGEVAALQRTLDELKRIDLRRSGGIVPPPPRSDSL